MKLKHLFAIAAVTMFILPAAVRAANICVWNYDTVDVWFDTEVGDTVDCAYWVQQALESQGHTVEVHNTYLPSSLNSYDVVFCLMGWYRC